ncbi:MAG: YjbQ family protein [Firmicutes bacterium]|nr:YjbQ family protein [Bacillota bacterium]
MRNLEIRTTKQAEFVVITSKVQRIIEELGIKEGICVVSIPHTTAGITINENADPDVVRDLLYKLDQLVPNHDPNYRHFEGNSAAHLKASLMGNSVSVPVHNGKLALGTWQGIYFCEFDGPRTRKIYIQAISSSI